MRPAGNTPLFRSMIDGAAALASDDPGRDDAVVVLTDGEDTSSGVGADAVSSALSGTGVRLVVVTIGEIRCSYASLTAITTSTAGECVDADLASLDTTLRTATARLWAADDGPLPARGAPTRLVGRRDRRRRGGRPAHHGSHRSRQRPRPARGQRRDRDPQRT